ncbi:hypothetical protein [Microbacterium sp. P04]|uniref:hypothetical protein n=1 Tax=Microbacterium sp. P04 TaxID=3366947 RepID=UPI0037450635
MTPVPVSPRRRRRGLVAALVGALLAIAGIAVVTPPAQAADQGSGFGTWAPLSAHGWHGSMLGGGVHTYCIVPGLPLPTGGTTDHGSSDSAAGLSPHQLAGINMLVSTYGQTADPVQGAAVGWAVKAIANRTETLHAWGYRGDSLAEAVHWSLASIAPEHSGAVGSLAESYYAEALAVAVPTTTATLSLSTDPADARRGSVAFDAAGPGTITLTHAVFADTGAAELAGAAPGIAYPITAVPPTDDGTPFSVQATVHGSAGWAPAVRHFTTPGQQDTAGPAGRVDFAAEARDAAPRPVVFSPGLSTQVAEPEAQGGPFIDDVDLQAIEGVWPRGADGAFVTISATARVYRTETVLPESGDVPAEAQHVGDLALTSNPDQGPGVYRVTSDWALPGPGVYTAVWQIDAGSQAEATVPHLEPGYVWQESFGVATQMVTVAAPPPPPQPEQPPTAQPPAPLDERPRALAATGPDGSTARLGGAGAAAVILGAALLAHLMQRRRRAESSPR